MYELFVTKKKWTGICEVKKGTEVVRHPSIALTIGQIFTARNRDEYNQLIYAGAGIPAELRGQTVRCVARVSGGFGGGLVLQYGQEYGLPAEDYVKFAVLRYVVPIDGATWSPDSPGPDGEPSMVKKFFEDVRQQALEDAKTKPGWVMGWREKS